MLSLLSVGDSSGPFASELPSLSVLPSSGLVAGGYKSSSTTKGPSPEFPSSPVGRSGSSEGSGWSSALGYGELSSGSGLSESGLGSDESGPESAESTGSEEPGSGCEPGSAGTPGSDEPGSAG